MLIKGSVSFKKVRGVVWLCLLSCRTAHKLHVANPSGRTTTFRVDTDLDFISGPPTITVADGDVEEYPFMVEPLERGSFTGAIVITTQSRSTAKIM